MGTLSSNKIANWFIAPPQFLIGMVHRWLMFLNAKYISLNMASSFGNNERYLLTFRKDVFTDGSHVNKTNRG